MPGELTPLLHERLVKAETAAKSFAAGADLFVTFTRTRVSEATARRYTERAGAVMEALEALEPCPHERSPAAPAEVKPSAGDPRPAWVGADGVFVRLVGGGWREVRTVSIGRVEPPRMVEGKERVTTTDLSYFSRLTESAEVFIDLAAVEFQRRGIADMPLVGAGSDGAEWCQHLFDRYCPEAERCLDFYHAGERVHAFSKALWKDGTLSEWYAGDQLHTLKHQGPNRLLAALGCWSQAGSEAKVREAAGAQHAFFAARRELLDYPGIRAKGLPIGTGNAESANLHVVQDRLKGPGKFWGREHVNPMLALRNAWCSDRWDEAWAVASRQMASGHYPVREVHTPKVKT